MLQFEGEWQNMFGNPEHNFRMMFWGPQKSGKSTLCLKFCDYLSKFGKVAYNSWEEGISETFKRRAIENNITSQKLFLLHKCSFEEIMDDSFKRKHYKTLVIDSVQYMRFTYEQYKQLIDKYPSKIILVINQANGKGGIKGGTDISHAVDATVYCSKGYAHIESRFTSKKTVQIYTPTKQPLKEGDQLKII